MQFLKRERDLKNKCRECIVLLMTRKGDIEGPLQGRKDAIMGHFSSGDVLGDLGNVHRGLQVRRLIEWTSCLEFE